MAIAVRHTEILRPAMRLIPTTVRKANQATNPTQAFEDEHGVNLKKWIEHNMQTSGQPTPRVVDLNQCGELTE